MMKYIQPLIIILGSTGSGKSKLAIEIANKFGGEIINADAMQMYKGLDIITNKMSKEEQGNVPHHLINFLDPINDKFNITDFKEHSVNKIQEIYQRNKLPIVVGGTNYYIESLLWDFTLKNKKISNLSMTNFGDICTQELYEKLLQIDFQSAQQLHPKDRRKIIRALEIYEETGLTKSELLLSQHSNHKGGNLVSGSLLFQNTCMIWLQCQQEILEERLNERVDLMIKNGLANELTDFYNHNNDLFILNKINQNIQQGILQSIGFKEFLPYLTNIENENSEKLFKEGVESMKIITRRYAKKQLKWIKNRFLKRIEADTPPIYALDSSNLLEWEKNVRDVSFNIVSHFLENDVASLVPLEHLAHDNPFVYKYCEHCDMHFVKELVWHAHISSKKHKKRLARNFLKNSFKNDVDIVK